MVIKINYTVTTILVAILFVFSCFGIGKLAIDAAGSPETVELPVIMYHHILKSKQGDYIVSPTQFEADLKYIRDNGYQTITAAELISFIDGDGTLPTKPIMITFDDGYESVYAYGYPLLKAYNMTAVSSVIGKHADVFSNPDEIKHLNYSHSNWDQLREMQDSGVFEIGNHTYDLHNDGSDGRRYGIKIKQGEEYEQYQQSINKDVQNFSERIEKELGAKPSAFAYPFGALCKESRKVLTDMEFKLVLTCEEKVNKIESGIEYPVSIKRFNRAAKYETTDFFAKFK